MEEFEPSTRQGVNGDRKRKHEKQTNNVNTTKRHRCRRAIDAIIQTGTQEVDNETLYKQLQAFDPDPGNENCRWIYKQFANKKFTIADGDRVREALRLFKAHADAMTRHERDLDAMDYERLLELIVPWDANRRTIALPANAGYGGLLEAAKAPRDTNDPDVRVVYRGVDGDLRVPLTRESSCAVGRGTRWCTAANSQNNMFDHYVPQGPLLVWRDFESGERFQFHFETNEFRDSENDSIDKFTLLKLRRRRPALDALFNEFEMKLVEAITPTDLKNDKHQTPFLFSDDKGLLAWTLKYRDSSRCEAFEHGFQRLLVTYVRSPREFLCVLRAAATYMQTIGMRQWPDTIKVRSAVNAFADPTGQAGLADWSHLQVPIYPREMHKIERLKKCSALYVRWQRSGGIVSADKSAKWRRSQNSLDVFCAYVFKHMAGTTDAPKTNYLKKARLMVERDSTDLVLFNGAVEGIRVVRSQRVYVLWESFTSEDMLLVVYLDDNAVLVDGNDRELLRKNDKRVQFPQLGRLIEAWETEEMLRIDEMMSRPETSLIAMRDTLKKLKNSTFIDWLDVDFCISRMLRAIQIDDGASLFEYLKLKHMSTTEEIERCVALALDNAELHGDSDALERLLRAVVLHAIATRVGRYKSIERQLLTAARAAPIFLMSSVFEYWRVLLAEKRWPASEAFLFEHAEPAVLYVYGAQTRTKLPDNVERRMLDETTPDDEEHMLLYYNKVYRSERWPAMEPVLTVLNLDACYAYAMGTLETDYETLEYDYDDEDLHEADTFRNVDGLGKTRIERVLSFEDEIIRRLSTSNYDMVRPRYLNMAKNYFKRTRSLFPNETWEQLDRVVTRTDLA